jgi:hypothetical protein
MPHLMILRPAEASRLSALFLWSGHKKTGRCPVQTADKPVDIFGGFVFWTLVVLVGF